MYQMKNFSRHSKIYYISVTNIVYKKIILKHSVGIVKNDNTIYKKIWCYQHQIKRHGSKQEIIKIIFDLELEA